MGLQHHFCWRRVSVLIDSQETPIFSPTPARIYESLMWVYAGAHVRMGASQPLNGV
jgi:hypothetical protein